MEPANFLRQYPALLLILLTLVVAEGLWRRVHGGRYPWKQTGATFAVWVGQVASNALARDHTGWANGLRWGAIFAPRTTGGGECGR